MDNLSKILVATAAINHLASVLRTNQIKMELSTPESLAIESIDETMRLSLGHLDDSFRLLSSEMEARIIFNDSDIQIISNALEIFNPIR